MKLLNYDPEHPSDAVMKVNLLSSLTLMLFGLFVEGDPAGSIAGMGKILFSDASLITDYIVTGGLGSAFLNAGLAMLLAIGVIHFSGAEFNGTSLACCYIVGGYGLFGKNILNMIPIIIGTWLFSKAVKKPFSQYATTANFATCCGPIVQYSMLHGLSSSKVLNILVGLLLALLIGFVMPAVAENTAKLHDGLMVYNIGFAAGFVCIIVTALLRGLGYEFFYIGDSWSKDHKLLLTFFLGLFFLAHFLTGLVMNKGVRGLVALSERPGKLPCDYVALDGLPRTLMNMGLLGLEAIALVWLIRGDMSGPVIAGILTVGGFGGLGENYKNVIWAWLGIILLAPVSSWNLTDPAVQLALMFVTCLSGIAGTYGPLYGIVAGMLHVVVARQTASFFSWINLYNNGFAAGLVTILYVPLIHKIQQMLGKEKTLEPK